ncbi:hypothetical protein CDAR_597231 [Caerostris darwini]|uniref:Uncharacterized protein n=1 Tax=Caerostris darwini TaxID=1538125 RepID=A0AAV4U2J0_9ARAC|nr:hypothetical protein CDAR_597231 [Caerostris darwini]
MPPSRPTPVPIHYIPALTVANDGSQEYVLYSSFITNKLNANFIRSSYVERYNHEKVSPSPPFQKEPVLKHMHLKGSNVLKWKEMVRSNSNSTFPYYFQLLFTIHSHMMIKGSFTVSEYHPEFSTKRN